jgi:hypothetical protein
VDLTLGTVLAEAVAQARLLQAVLATQLRQAAALVILETVQQQQ